MYIRKYCSQVTIFVAMILYMSSVYSIELSEQEIDKIGSHNGQTMYFLLKSTALLDNQCVHGVMYCPSSNPECKSMLSIALTAKTTGSKITLSFDKDTDNVCKLSNIRF